MAPRVCQLCGMGVLLTCVSEALPGARAAFVIVTVDLRISAVSEAAEAWFGTERSLLGQPMLSLLGSPMGEDQLARTVTRAALRARKPEMMPVRGVRPEGANVGMLAGRISTCGPPRGALVTVEPSGFGLR